MIHGLFVGDQVPSLKSVGMDKMLWWMLPKTR